jgi:hypothetical protein
MRCSTAKPCPIRRLTLAGSCLGKILLAQRRATYGIDEVLYLEKSAPADAGSVAAAMNPATSNADNAIDSFMLISLYQELHMISKPSTLRGRPLEANTECEHKADR